MSILSAGRPYWSIFLDAFPASPTTQPTLRTLNNTGSTRVSFVISFARLYSTSPWRALYFLAATLATTDVGRTSGPPVAEDNEDVASEASEWEARDQAERAWERKVEAVRLGEE